MDFGGFVATDPGSGSGSMWGNLISNIADSTIRVIGAVRRPAGSTAAGGGFTTVNTLSPPGAGAGALGSYGFMLMAGFLVVLYLAFKK